MQCKPSRTIYKKAWNNKGIIILLVFGIKNKNFTHALIHSWFTLLLCPILNSPYITAGYPDDADRLKFWSILVFY